LTSLTCLAIPWLVAPEVLPGEGSWVAVLASTSVINAQATAPNRWSVPAGLLITAAYATGSTLAGQVGEAGAHAATLLVQTGLTAVMTGLMRRRIGQADRAFVEHQRVTQEALRARTAREVERRHNRDLHDTLLATLTMVGLGAVREPTPALRERCIADLRILTLPADPRGVSVPTSAGAPPVALDDRLRRVLDRLPDLPVLASLPPCPVPAPVAEALAASVHAALSNVERHAPGARVTLSLTREGGTVVVEVTDDGPGFDPTLVPAHRYGLRESVRGRTEAVGGRAEVRSAPGAGTRLRLEWPGDH
jgi:signal transduction histidine kinase